MLCLKDIEKLNIIDFLHPYKPKIAEIFIKDGTRSTRKYIYDVFRIKVTGAEIREFLGVDKNNLFQEVHRQAWSICGWNGSYSPLAVHRHMDTSKSSVNQKDEFNESQVMVNQNTVNLIAAGLLSPGCRLNIK